MFLILTSPRTGSELLASAISAHPDLNCKSEILNPHRYRDWRREVLVNLYGVDDLPFTSHIDQTVPVSTLIYDQTERLADFVRHYLWRYDGFKVTYDQITTDSPVVCLLRCLPKLKIIFIERDHLDSAVSYWFAMRSQVWEVSPDEPAVEDQPQDVDPAFVCRYKQDAMRDNQLYRAIFNIQPTLTIKYADLVGQWDSTIEEVQRFLGLTPVPVAMPLKKRLNRPPNELVTNWNQLWRFPN